MTTTAIKMGRQAAAFLGLLMTVGSIALLQSVAAETYLVGDAEGWTVPNSANVPDYKKFSSEHTYVVGDILSFKYNKEKHNVISLKSQDAFDTCNLDSATTFEANGSTEIVLNTTGIKYYTCGRTGHCGSGQKFWIKVEQPFLLAPSPAGAPPASPPEAGSASSPRGFQFASVIVFGVLFYLL